MNCYFTEHNIQVPTRSASVGKTDMWKHTGWRVTRRPMRYSRGVHDWWGHVKPAPMDPIVSVTDAFLSDKFPGKINLVGGACKDDEGKPLVLQYVREAETKIPYAERKVSYSSAVSSNFLIESARLLCGKNLAASTSGRFAAVPALSGTGACRLFAEFQRRISPDSQIYLSDPTWPNHHSIWRCAQVPVRTYRYYCPDTKSLNFVAFKEDVKNAPDGSFFLLHPCGHNPTGVDPTEEQWREISYLFQVKNHFPFFDMAYQGLVSGDLDRDAQAIHIFLEAGHLIGCSQSFSKNMGFRWHKVGCLSVLCKDVRQAATVKSQLQQIAHVMYGSPPLYGILLVSTILSDQHLKALWAKELKVTVNQIQKMRSTLRRSLENLDSALNWEHLTSQVGLFCFSGLRREQIELLEKSFHIYMTRDGRMSMASVTPSNVKYVANAIHQVTTPESEASCACN